MIELTLKNTTIVIFSSGDTPSDYSGLLSAQVAYNCFSNKGFGLDQILVFADTNLPQSAPLIQSMVNRPNCIHTPDKLYEEIPKIKTPFVIFMSVGHGGLHGLVPFNGIDFKPYKVKKLVEGNEKIKKTIFMWGSCYAGVYKSISSGKILQMAGSDLVLGVGFSDPQKNVHHPMSTYIKYNLLWMCGTTPPQDIDGDGQTSLADLHTFSAVCSHEFLNDKKQVVTRHIQELELKLANLSQEKLRLSQTRLNQNDANYQTLHAQLNQQLAQNNSQILATQRTINTQFNILYNEQIPWSSDIHQLQKVKISFN